MTTKTSLFNKGIYKSTVKRYAWGSVLYAAVLFFVSVLPFILNGSATADGYVYETTMQFYNANREGSVLLMKEYAYRPLLLSMIVPTLAGLLVFRYMHSQKAAIFTHSLPVKRATIYISSVLAAFTRFTFSSSVGIYSTPSNSVLA